MSRPEQEVCSNRKLLMSFALAGDTAHDTLGAAWALFAWMLWPLQMLWDWIAPRLHRLILAVLRRHLHVPRHVAFIMDGNRRYARRHHMHQHDGHLMGFQKLEQVRTSEITLIERFWNGVCGCEWSA